MHKRRTATLNELLDIAYQQMAQDETREAEALAWAEAMIGDVSDEDLPLSRECPS